MSRARVRPGVGGQPTDTAVARSVANQVWREVNTRWFTFTTLAWGVAHAKTSGETACCRSPQSAPVGVSTLADIDLGKRGRQGASRKTGRAPGKPHAYTTTPDLFHGPRQSGRTATDEAVGMQHGGSLSYVPPRDTSLTGHLDAYCGREHRTAWAEASACHDHRRDIPARRPCWTRD